MKKFYILVGIISIVFNIILGTYFIVNRIEENKEIIIEQEQLESTVEEETFATPEVIIIEKEEKPIEEEKFEDTNEYTFLEILQIIEKLEEDKENTHSIADYARELNLAEDSEIIIFCQENYMTINEKQEYYAKRLGEDSMYEKYLEWPNATIIWMYLQDSGYNDYACAGIIGNMMSECGGEGLTIKTWTYNPNEHGGGICGWKYEYTPGKIQMHKQSLSFQLDYLVNHPTGGIENQFNHYGEIYKNFTFDSYKTVNNCEDAAIAFAKIYERCSSQSYQKRIANAFEVYNYFVNNN